MSNQPVPSNEELVWMYEKMLLNRRWEESIKDEYLEGKVPVFNMAAGPIPGEMHLSCGQEPCAVGVCVHLNQNDYVVGSHRPHHVAVAKGVDLNAMTAEVYGKANGLGRGKGGHMHLFDAATGFSCSGIVGQSIGIGLGHALAASYRNDGTVSVAFTGEGGVNQGIFHEAMNLAALWKLPFVCIVEDNRWGVSVSKASSTAIERNSDRAASYGIVGEYVENNDVWGVYAAAKRAVDRARAGEGPTIIEIETARLAGHFVGDPESYVPSEELSAREDPIDVMRTRMVADGVFTEAEAQRLNDQAMDVAAKSIVFAQEDTYPQADEAFDHVYA